MARPFGAPPVRRQGRGNRSHGRWSFGTGRAPPDEGILCPGPFRPPSGATATFSPVSVFRPSGLSRRTETGLAVLNQYGSASRRRLDAARTFTSSAALPFGLGGCFAQRWLPIWPRPERVSRPLVEYTSRAIRAPDRRDALVRPLSNVPATPAVGLWSSPARRSWPFPIPILYRHCALKRVGVKRQLRRGPNLDFGMMPQYQMREFAREGR